jgi:mxaJ protein
MFSHCRRAALTAALVAASAAAYAQEPEKVRVCADPNNLPFSNSRGEGFENRIADLLARDLGAPLEYVWWAQRRGFIRNTLRARDCDIVMGVPKDYELTLNTKPYYSSTYVIVARETDGSEYRSLDDPKLAQARIGVQLIGDDFANTPPAHALTKRGLIANIRGYMVYGDYRNDNPAGDIVRAVADREIDVAFVWGPFAGFFAPRQNEKLIVTPLPGPGDGPGIPFVFEIAMGVRKGETALRDRLNRWIELHRADITAILAEYGVLEPGGQ